MDPLTASITIILGKYALDKGLELGKEIGPQALATAEKMFTAVLNRLRKNPEGKFVADKFEESPETYQKPLEEELDKVIQDDPDFAAQLQALREQLDELAKEHAAATGKVYQATVTSSGGLAQDSSVATGAGGVAVGRDVGGDVRIDSPWKDEAGEA